jgi:hypothetical protein
LAAVIVGIVVLDVGTQGMQITNQAIIYALRPDARSRINSAYMVCHFIGAGSRQPSHVDLGRRQLPSNRGIEALRMI